MEGVPPSPPLSTMLSQALVAHTIEIDNETEHRLPHRTTRRQTPDAGRDGPWLVSFTLWANVLQHVDGEGTTVGDLRARARTGQLLLNGLQRWGYVSVTPPTGESLRNPPQDGATVTATRAARRAQEVWRQLPPVIDGRWRDRLGASAVDRLERALRAVFDELPFAPPASLPVVHPTQGARSEGVPPRGDTGSQLPADGVLSPLLSGVLLAFTLDFEAESRISLPISASTLRVLGAEGARVGDLPRCAGVSRQAQAMSTGWLERHGCVVTERDPTARRGRIARLTSKGEKAQQKYRRLLTVTEESWGSRYGAPRVDELRASLHAVVGDGTYTSSPLAAGLVPHPDNWRARVRRPQTLPHHPMVLHRGGFPDGN
jgi:DNA-binding MarR family transcriptional regulator